MRRVINIVSKPKKGKTVSAGTFPKPMAFIDFDRGFSSIQYTKGKDGKLIIPDWKEVVDMREVSPGKVEPITVGGIKVFEFYKKAPADLTFASYLLQINKKGDATALGPAPEYTKEGPKEIGRYNTLMKELYAEKYGHFETLVIDNLTAMFRIWRDCSLATNNIPELRRGDYLSLEGVLVNMFIPSLKALNDIIPWIICISHEDYDSNTDGAVINEYPVGPTKALGRG